MASNAVHPVSQTLRIDGNIVGIGHSFDAQQGHQSDEWRVNGVGSDQRARWRSTVEIVDAFLPSACF